MGINRNIILKTMMDIGMPMGNLGTMYATDVLEMICEREYTTFNDVYKLIANRYQTSYQNVEKCINKAFTTCRDRPIDYDIVDKYLGYARLGTGETLIHLLVRIRLEYEK